MRRPIPTRLTALALAAGLVLAACGGDDEETRATGGTVTTAAPTGAQGDAFPVTILTADGELTLDEQPDAIVSLSPSATETLYAIGAGDQVAAVDEYSYFPAEAPVTDLSGFTPNVEAIAGYEPDLVILSGDANDVVAGLEALDIPVLVVPAATTLDDAWSSMDLLGQATGHADEAADVIAQAQARIDELVADLPERAEPLTYFHELGAELYTATSSTFIGAVYALAGLENVADPADTDQSGYPQLSEEFLLQADPDLIFLADTKCCNESAATVAARPGWDVITAVEQGNVIELDDDIASRWGPRIVDLVEAVTTAVAAVPAA